MQTGSSVRGSQMSVPGNQQADHAWAPDDSRQYSSEDTLKQGVGRRHVINAVMAWSAPAGTVESQALGKLNSLPTAMKSRTCRAMLDTGATINYIHRTWVQDLGLSRHIRNTHVREARDANFWVRQMVDLIMVTGP